MKEGLIGNRLLRLAWRSDFGLGRRSSVRRSRYLGGPETRISAGKSSADAEISVLQGRTTHRNQCIHMF